MQHSTVLIVEPSEVNRRIAVGNSFVVNIVAAWCPDCTVRQKPHIDGFAQKLAPHGIDVLQVNVQLTKGEFISNGHEQLTALFGGHGFPRTVLIEQGKVIDQDNVEIITEEALSELAGKFLGLLSKIVE